MNKFITALTLLLVAIQTTHALTPQEIADKAASIAYYQGDSGKARATMEIKDSQDRIRERKLVILRRDKADLGQQEFYVYFEAPSDVYQTTFLVHKNPDGDDDRWLYLPALDLTRRIAASDERTSFVGSHFYYEDVSGRSPNEDTHELVEESETYYVLKSTPKAPGKVEFASYKSWIHKKTFLAVKTEYTNAQGKVYRTYEAAKVGKIDGFTTVTEARMTDLERGGSTTLRYEDVQYNLPFDDSIFTERALRSPPMEYLK